MLWPLWSAAALRIVDELAEVPDGACLALIDMRRNCSFIWFLLLAPGWYCASNPLELGR